MDRTSLSKWMGIVVGTALLSACPPGDPNGPDGGTDAGVVADTDVVLARFDSSGQLDPSFGSQGIAQVDLGRGQGTVRDSVWDLAVDAQDRLVVFGSARAGEARDDSDRTVLRLTAQGAVDNSFSEDGIQVLDLGGLSDNIRGGLVQADGKIVSSGYAAQPSGAGAQTANAIVLLRLNQDGTPDSSFGYQGVVNSNPYLSPLENTPAGYAEAYGVGRQSSGAYVTGGYGKPTAAQSKVDLISARYTAAGTLDPTWATEGVFALDLIGDNDRARNVLVLPDDRVLLVGSGIEAAGDIDAMAVLLDADGAPASGLGAGGPLLTDFQRPDEAFFDAAVSADGQWVAATGYRAGAVAGVTEDDDSLLMLWPTAGGAATTLAVELSPTASDRLWAVTYDAQGRALAVGFLDQEGDTRMVLVRFLSDGTLDPAFGTAGIAQLNVIESGNLETARAVAVQSDGKIVIAGVAETR